MNIRFAVIVASLASTITVSAFADKRMAQRPVVRPAADIKWTPLVPELETRDRRSRSSSATSRRARSGCS